MFQHGKGIEKNISEVIYRYKMEIELKNIFSMVNLANLFLKGEDAEHDIKEVIHLSKLELSIRMQ
jgi:hypothetical protein